MDLVHQSDAVPSSPSPSPSAVSDDDGPPDPTVSFFTNFVIGATIFLFVLVLYDLLRYYFPGHCYYRARAAQNPANNNYDGTPLRSPPTPSHYPLSWVLPTFHYPLRKLIITHGLDAAMYLRFLQTQARIFFALTVFTSIVLIPTYATTSLSEKDDQPQPPLGLERASLANVSDRSVRLWVTLVSEIVVVATILIFLYLDMVMFTKCRIKYRNDNKKNPSNFAALIMDIPRPSRDQSYIFNVFNSIFPGQVVAVHPVRDAHHLLTLKTRYIAAVNKRQRAQLSSATSNSNPATTPPSEPEDAPPPTPLRNGAANTDNNENVPPSNEYTNSESRRKTSILTSGGKVTNSAGANNVTPVSAPPVEQIGNVDSRINSRTAQEIANDKTRQLIARVGFDLENAVTIPISTLPTEHDDDIQHLMDWKPRNPISGLPTQSFADYGDFDNYDNNDSEMGRPTNAISNSNRVIHPMSGGNHASERSSFSFQLPSPTLRALTRTDSDHIAQHDRQVKKARDLLMAVEKDMDHSAPITHAAFVVFRSKIATTCAVTAPIFPSTTHFKISRAPDPRAVNWNRIIISRYTTRIREYVTGSVLIALTLFWTIPSTFIQLLGNLKELGETLTNAGGSEFVQTFVRNNPGFASFLEGVLPPLLLFLVLLIIPQVMRLVISFERIASRVQGENKVRNFLFFFYVMSNFVYQVGFGSIFRQLQDIVNNPREILSILSTSIPGQASFLMKYVLINSFLGSVLGMLNIGRLLFRPLVRWRAKTERDRIHADRLFADFPFAKMYALCMMIALISYVYATIAPIINAVACLYFILAYMCTKQLLLYSHRPMFEGGGYLFRDAWSGLLIGLYVHQFAMIGIFSLKKAPMQAVLATVSFAFSIWFTILCRNRFLSRIENGSLLKSPLNGRNGEEEEENDDDDDDENNNESSQRRRDTPATRREDNAQHAESTAGVSSASQIRDGAQRIRDHPMIRFRHSPVMEEESLWGSADEIPKQFINMYVHPGLKPVEVLENTSMDPATASLTRRASRRRSLRPVMIESFNAIDSLE